MRDSFSVDISKPWRRDEGHPPTQQPYEKLFGNRRERIDADQSSMVVDRGNIFRRLIEVKRFYLCSPILQTDN
jgi:hypothetical protein